MNRTIRRSRSGRTSFRHRRHLRCDNINNKQRHATSRLILLVQHQPSVLFVALGSIMNAEQSLQITPPESFTSSPPTPPATEEKTLTSIPQILAGVRRHKDGYSLPAGEHWLRFSLEEDHYRNLQRKLRKANLWDYYEHKLRYV